MDLLLWGPCTLLAGVDAFCCPLRGLLQAQYAGVLQTSKFRLDYQGVHDARCFCVAPPITGTPGNNLIATETLRCLVAQPRSIWLYLYYTQILGVVGILSGPF